MSGGGGGVLRSSDTEVSISCFSCLSGSTSDPMGGQGDTRGCHWCQGDIEEVQCVKVIWGKESTQPCSQRGLYPGIITKDPESWQV